MAQAIPFIVNAAVNGAVAIGNALGLSAGTTIAIAQVTALAVSTAVPLVVTAGIGMATAPSLPDPESFATPMRQPIPPRQTGYGRARISGPLMLWEAKGGTLYDIYALHHGRIEGFETYYLHDDVVTLNGSNQVNALASGAYQAHRVRIYTRLGAATETSYSTDVDFSPLGGGVWGANHRGDGIASACVITRSVEQADMAGTYPNGAPLFSAVALLSPVYDWRDEAQDPDDPDTWTASENWVVQLVDFLTSTEHGMGFDWDKRIAPNLATITAAADICDEEVELANSSTEPRYRAGGMFSHTTAPVEVIQRLLSCGDGWLSQTGDGAFVIRAGKYEDPEVTFSSLAGHVTGLAFQRFLEDEQAVNELVLSFCSPAHEFNVVETDPWRDEDSIAARGEKSQPLALPWVPSNGQARRLAKRTMARLASGTRGTVRTNLYGLRGLGERYIRLQIPEVSTLTDIVVEVQSVEIDLANLSLTFGWVAADPNVDAWNPATEEGDGPATEGRVAGEALTAATVDDVTPYFEINGTGGTGVRLQIEASGPDRDDLTWYARWRVDGAVSWSEAEYSDVDPDDDVVLETGFVTADQLLEVEVTYGTGGGDIAPWSDPFPVDTSVDTVSPGSPSNLNGDSPDTGKATLTWRNPIDSNFDHARVYRADDPDAFGLAVDVSGALPGAAGADMQWTEELVPAGTYRYWVVAENTANEASAPTGPEVVVIA